MTGSDSVVLHLTKSIRIIYTKNSAQAGARSRLTLAVMWVFFTLCWRLHYDFQMKTSNGSIVPLLYDREPFVLMHFFLLGSIVSYLRNCRKCCIKVCVRHCTGVRMCNLIPVKLYSRYSSSFTHISWLWELVQNSYRRQVSEKTNHQS